MDRRDIERQYAAENAWIRRHGLKKKEPRGKAALAIQEQIRAENVAALEWLQRLEGHGDYEWRSIGTREFASIKSPSVGEEAILHLSSTSAEMLRPDRCKYVPPKTDDSDRDGESSEFSPTCKAALYFDRYPAIAYGKPQYGIIQQWTERNFPKNEYMQWRLGFWFQGELDRTADIRRVRSWRLVCCQPPMETKGTICDPTVKSISDGPMGSKWETVSAGLLPRVFKAGAENYWRVMDLKKLQEQEERLRLAVCENRNWKWPKRADYWLTWRVLPMFKIPNAAWPMPKLSGPPKRRRLPRYRGQVRNSIIEVQAMAPEIEVRRLRACGNEIEALRVENRTVLEIAVRLGISKRTAERKIAAIEADHETQTTVR
ncbi:MAG TPA: hypothetical protein VFO46_06060 [Candidatus Sulfotelmatobacter sp.]|nr:hypothetical protein [Candidatus Sulfotelmatobacter sp.]